MRITISELELRLAEPILDQLTPWEMKTLKGGYVMRKDRRNPPTTNITNTTDLSTVFKELESCGFTNLKKDGACSFSDAITFNGTQADVETFVDYNSFELTEEDFILDRRAED